LVPVVRGPRPAAAGHARRPEIRAPVGHRAEVTSHERAERAGRIAAPAAEVGEIELVVLDAPDRERQIDLQGADLRVDLVRGREVDAGELPEDLVPLGDVALIELVVRFDRGARDPVELVHLGAQLSRRDLLELEDKRHRTPLTGTRLSGGSISSGPTRKEHEWPSNFPISRTPTTRSSRRSTRRRCGSTTTCITRPTLTTRTPRPTEQPPQTTTSSPSAPTSRPCARTSRRRSGTTRAATRTIPSSGRSWARTAAASRRATSRRRSKTPSAASTP